MEPYIVRAEYSFKGGNNDELCFKKGDIITVTNREEGGWWEGTLDEKTGWFPSNYVKEYKAPLPLSETIRPPEEIQAHRTIVLKDLLESEKAHVAEIRGLLENFLEPLTNSQILTADEYAQLMGNFVDIVQMHETLYCSLEECNDRVGKLFLNKAPVIKNLHQIYCAGHPKAIIIVDKYKDALESYMEKQGAASPGLLVLTTGLSKPFRRLDKYSAMLQELERHMESSHPDRGDTQRSVAIYKDIAATCAATRRQKELELQVLTGPVRGWQGQELSSLGDIIHMGSVAVGADHRDRYFVLFPQTLLILSVSQRMSAFIYEGKLPLTGIVVKRLEDTETIKNAFEISGPLIETIVAICQGPNEANKWYDLLTSRSFVDGLYRPPGDMKRNTSNPSVSGAPQPPPHKYKQLDSRGYSTRTSIWSYESKPLKIRYTMPPRNYPPTAPYANLTAHFRRHVKYGRLKRFIVKALLYPEFLRDIDLSHIKLRRKKKKRGVYGCEDCTGSSGHSEASLERQDAFDLPTSSDEEDISDTDSSDTDAFSYVNYKTGRKNSSSSRTDFESFAANRPDYDCTRRIFDELEKTKRCQSSVSIDRNSSGTFVIRKLSVTSNQSIDRDSLPFGSRPVKMASKQSSKESVVHTSTVTLDLGSVKEQCTESEVSSLSFDPRADGKMACEDLLDLDDSMIINIPGLMQPIVYDSRHSLPCQFVGNRFNISSMTEVYMPGWEEKTKKEPNTAVKENLIESNSPITTHSSSLDLPVALPAPDEMSIELLYNKDNYNSLHKKILNPPSMFKDEPSRSNSKCSQKTTDEEEDESKENLNPRPTSAKRCISYQYLKLKVPNQQHSHSPAPMLLKCRCCASSRCPSPRSSDSGMAGSCTTSSPDPPKYSDDYTTQFVEDCARNSNAVPLRHSQSTHNFEFNDESVNPELETIDVNDVNFEGTFGRHSIRCHSTERSINVDGGNNKKDTSGIVINLNDYTTEKSFKTGLYAHWWKKEKLPNEVLIGLLNTPRSPSPIKSKQDDDDKMMKLTRGSDEQYTNGNRFTVTNQQQFTNVPAQTKPIVQPSFKLQSVPVSESSEFKSLRREYQRQQQIGKSAKHKEFNPKS